MFFSPKCHLSSDRSSFCCNAPGSQQSQLQCSITQSGSPTAMNVSSKGAGEPPITATNINSCKRREGGAGDVLVMSERNSWFLFQSGYNSSRFYFPPLQNNLLSKYLQVFTNDFMQHCMYIVHFHFPKSSGMICIHVYLLSRGGQTSSRDRTIEMR